MCLQLNCLQRQGLGCRLEDKSLSMWDGFQDPKSECRNQRQSMAPRLHHLLVSLIRDESIYQPEISYHKQACISNILILCGFSPSPQGTDPLATSQPITDWTTQDLVLILKFKTLHVWVFCLYVCLCTTCMPSTFGSQKVSPILWTGVTDGCELWLWVVNLHVGAETLNPYLWKSN